jgi:hypothetical protein
MLLAFRLHGDLGVELPADVPEDVANAIRLAVRSAFDHIAGAWRVVVQRCSDRGRWRIELRGVTGRHVWTVLGRPEMLPQLIGDKLEAFIWASSALHYARVFSSRPAGPDAGLS